MSRVKLKECPFCHKSMAKNYNREMKRLNQTTGEVVSLGFRVFCGNCGAYGPEGEHMIEAGLLWNDRRQVEKHEKIN